MGYKVKRIYQGTNLVRPVWTPDASRTLLYLPLESNATDYSGNNRSTTPYNVTYANLGGVKCANANGSSTHIYIPTSSYITKNVHYGTMSIWVYCVNYNTSGAYSKILESAVANKNSFCFNVTLQGKISGWLNGGPGDIVSITKNQWIHLCATSSDSSCKWYINGNFIKNSNNIPGWAWGGENTSNNGDLQIFSWRDGASGFFKGGARELILESKQWTDAEILNYYNQTKSTYGL